MKTLFFNILKAELVKYLTEKFTAANVQKLLQKVLDLAKAKAAETQTALDDALIQAVEYFIIDSNAAEKLVSLALQLLDGQKLCADPAVEEVPVGEQIAAELHDWAETW
ncbi:MAG: hypothetical protein IJQ31_14920 [Thermoguttaceae bacterium]|nr:hypothetical protein [Thermoguttaceae bacterium]